MLEVARTTPLQARHVSESKGGFVWWYADLQSGPDEGLVVLWSLGLPFLPGSREELVARSRPAVSIAHYKGGRQNLYLLQSYSEQETDLDLATGSGRIGDSIYTVEQSSGQVSLTILLDEPMPGTESRLTGTIEMKGSRSGLPLTKEQNPQHVWSPIALHCQARAQLQYDGKKEGFEGTGYFDSNLSRVPLHRQGIASWRWGRISFDDMTVVYYEVEESDGAKSRHLYRQSRRGPLERLQGRISFDKSARGTYGLSGPQEVYLAAPDLSVSATMIERVEDGPFYQRCLVRAEDHRGKEGFGFAEVVAPSLVDRPWQRPLVRMRTHNVGGENSTFLPLFNGSRNSRAGRLLHSLSDALRPAAVRSRAS